MRVPTLPLPLARAMVHPFYRMVFRPDLPWRVQRALLNGAARFQPLPAGTVRRNLVLGDRDAEHVEVDRGSGPGVVLYLHGGGFTVGSIATHRSLAAHLARDTRRPVYLADYRLSPEHRCPAAVVDAVAAFLALVRREGHAPGAIALAGDSAGGGIALAAAQWLIRDHGMTPAALVLISPWANPALVAERHRDVVVNRAWGFACASAYLGDGDERDWRYAPALGALGGLPPTYVYAAEREMLRDQIVDLAVGLRRSGTAVRYVESTRLWHAAQAQAGIVRQAADSVRDIARFLGSRWSAVE
ncbi:alpha/beta hydrolase fold domain-containing protein [Actinophytocola sp.]|uniref:alpha/beta hydrolase fold domain-containing protein n=1 Tax=Actinophytocola sp. TaxID=1872138 RepID=UPI003D6BDF56